MNEPTGTPVVHESTHIHEVDVDVEVPMELEFDPEFAFTISTKWVARFLMVLCIEVGLLVLLFAWLVFA